MKTEEIEKLTTDGFTERFAKLYLAHLEKEKKNGLFEESFINWAHERGFFAETAKLCGLTEDNYHNYMSDYDYYKIWPFNNWTKLWVDDKLTLKQITADPQLEGFLPEYYYYSYEGQLFPQKEQPICTEHPEQDFLALLREKKEFACKPCNGTRARGFFRLAYEDGKYFINRNEATEEEIIQFTKQYSNYIFTEYLRPSREMAVFGDTIHTLRVVVINEGGRNPQIIGGYFRLPNAKAGEINYIECEEKNDDNYNIFCDFDFEKGVIGRATKTFSDHIEEIEVHPDTGAKIQGTKVTGYEQLLERIHYLCCKMSTLEYIGFDLGVTDDGIKCMEINTFPGTEYMQVFHPFYENETVKNFFEKKLKENKDKRRA
jgi:hypothetical protein